MLDYSRGSNRYDGYSIVTKESSGYTSFFRVELVDMGFIINIIETVARPNTDGAGGDTFSRCRYRYHM